MTHIPNIVATTTILGVTDIMPSVPVTMSPITLNPFGSGKVMKINTLTVSNKQGQQDQDVHVALGRIVPQTSGTPLYYETYFAYAVVVPQDASLLVIGKHNPIYLNEGDALILMAGEADALDAICSYEEIS